MHYRLFLTFVHVPVFVCVSVYLSVHLQCICPLVSHADFLMGAGKMMMSQKNVSVGSYLAIYMYLLMSISEWLPLSALIFNCTM